MRYMHRNMSSVMHLRHTFFLRSSVIVSRTFLARLENAELNTSAAPRSNSSYVACEVVDQSTGLELEGLTGWRIQSWAIQQHHATARSSGMWLVTLAPSLLPPLLPML